MEEHKIEKQRAVWSIAIILVSLIAIAGFIVAYVQYDQKKDYMAQATEALNAQEKRVMESYDQDRKQPEKNRAVRKYDQREHD